MKLQKTAILLAFLAAGLSTQAPARADDDAIGRRLSAIEARQEEIINRLEEIRTELQIVKVRATN